MAKKDPFLKRVAKTISKITIRSVLVFILSVAFLAFVFDFLDIVVTQPILMTFSQIVAPLDQLFPSRLSKVLALLVLTGIALRAFGINAFTRAWEMLRSRSLAN